MTQAHANPDAHDHAAHPPHLAHHFDTPQQQFESGKLGMWVFLATEILMFGGLFCAYSVYRASHPEVFLYAHHYLDKNLGALNTAILLISSFTMAWGVRAAQLGQKRLLPWLMALTFLGGTGFMIIKGIEYQTKFSHDLGPGVWNVFAPPSADDRSEHLDHLEESYGLGEPGHGAHGAAEASHGDAGDAATHAAAEPAPIPAVHSVIAPAAVPPQGLDAALTATDRVPAIQHQGIFAYEELAPPEQARVHIFFQIYFLMTGLHGIHVLVGMGLITYIFIRSLRADFGPSYFTPVDIVGLYWHLVDLIWIFLFPLLYLIH